MQWLRGMLKMNIVKILKGLPASGKTTRAKMLEAQGWVRINKDEIRNQQQQRLSETKVLAIRNDMLDKALSTKANIVIDDTNLHPSHERCIRELVGDRAKVEVEFLDVPVTTCVSRDMLREKSVGALVIYGMYNKYIKGATTE